MGSPIRFILNDESIESRLHPGTVVLDFLRVDRRLTGTKEGCREGDCGACTVLLGEPTGQGWVEYRSVNSCLLPLGDVEGKHLVSIEGINPEQREANGTDTALLTPVQERLVEHGAIQCGFCTPGLVVSLTGYLLGSRSWSFEQALDAVAGNICRCTGYTSIKRAIADLLDRMTEVRESHQPGGAVSPDRAHLQGLVAHRVVPQYFLTIPERLRSLKPSVRRQGRPGRCLVAGGTDLFVQRPEQMFEEDLSFLSHSPQMGEVSVEKDRLLLGAGLTMEKVREVPELRELLPELVEALSLIASVPIRNRATLGGNIVNASPIGDFTVMLLALGGVLELRSGKASRRIPLERFFLGYKKLDIRPGERLRWIVLPRQRGRFSFEKVSRRRHLDIASVNTAAWISSRGDRIDEVRLAAGGVAPVPLLLSRASACLQAQQLSDESIEETLEAAQEEIAPISDVRGSADYKRLLLRQLLLAHFQKLFPERLRAEAWI